MSDRLGGFRGEFLWEWDIAERQLTQLANAFPADEYEWKPDTTARSVSEVLIHISCGTFMLLEWLGLRVPPDLYAELPEEPESRMWAIVKINDELERSVRQKDKVLSLLRRALVVAREKVKSTDDATLEQSLSFFGEPTTVRRVLLRLLAHTHEHMGQLIAYTRMRGLTAPWPDWRPDRQKL